MHTCVNDVYNIVLDHICVCIGVEGEVEKFENPKKNRRKVVKGVSRGPKVKISTKDNFRRNNIFFFGRNKNIGSIF